MPIPKNARPPQPNRFRSFPQRWSWFDCQLLDSGILSTMTGEEAILYFALLAVSDRQGLSWWRDDTLGRRAGLNEDQFLEAGRRLVEKGLVAFRPFRPGCRHGVWQVLDLPVAGERRSEL